MWVKSYYSTSITTTINTHQCFLTTCSWQTVYLHFLDVSLISQTNFHFMTSEPATLVWPGSYCLDIIHNVIFQFIKAFAQNLSTIYTFYCSLSFYFYVTAWHSTSMSLLDILISLSTLFYLVVCSSYKY